MLHFAIETRNPEINDYFDIRAKIIIPHVVCSFGKIKYETKKTIKEFKITDPTLKSKITVCVTQALNYLTNLPFKIPIQIKLDNILIDEKNGLDSLPDKLQSLARFRLSHPELSLKEVAEQIPDGPISKSGVNHRFKKLRELADGLRA